VERENIRRSGAHTSPARTQVTATSNGRIRPE